MNRFGILWLFVLPIAFVTMACGNSEETPTATPTPETTPTETQQPVVITIGNLSDITGVSSNAMEIINMALDDLVEYYNENNLIPGVRLNVITYDGQMNPARDIPGYEWLREKGADLIFTPIPATPTTLKPRVENDEVVLFAMAASREAYLPPGYVFNLGVEAQYEAYTLLKWIAENDWDYEAKGPAKVGGAAWSESYSDVLLVAMEKYCSTHPDQFVWEGGYLTAFSMNWQAEVEALKDCDYVYPGILFISFVEQYREAGYTEAKFLGSDTSAAFMGSVDSAERWDEIDGMFFLRASHWWNEEGEIVNLVKQLVHKNHSSETERIVSSGVGYMAINQLHAMFSIIADAVEAVGPENFNSQALYNAAESFSMTINGIPRFSFGEDKRWMTDIYGIYEARGAEKDIFRVNDEWYPVVCNP